MGAILINITLLIVNVLFGIRNYEKENYKTSILSFFVTGILLIVIIFQIFLNLML